MADPVYSDFEAIEDTVNGSVIHTLTHKSREIMLMNDSTQVNLTFKFRAGEAYGTLKPGEVMSMNIWAEKVWLQSVSAVPYRLWALG